MFCIVTTLGGEVPHVQKGYTVMDVFVDHMTYFILSFCFTSVGGGDKLNLVSLVDLFKFRLRLFKGKEEL